MIRTEGIVDETPISIQNLDTSRYIIKRFKNNYLMHPKLSSWSQEQSGTIDQLTCTANVDGVFHKSKDFLQAVTIKGSLT